jgi:Fur family iron response transcriptional regulator
MENKTYTRESLPALLRAHGISPTHQRIEIAHAILSRGEHVSADRILALANDRATETSKATVYNTLKLFVECKLIREVIADPGKVFYDPNTAPHHHFYDIDSGELTDIDARDIAVTGLPPLPHGAVAEGIDVIVRVRTRVS